MTRSTPPTIKAPDPISARLRRYWQRWGRATLIAVVAHACIGALLVALYLLSRPPPPRYVVVELLPPSAAPAPSAAAD